MTAFYYCTDCEFEGCECGGGFYEDANEPVPMCPCCGSVDVSQ